MGRLFKITLMLAVLGAVGIEDSGGGDLYGDTRFEYSINDDVNVGTDLYEAQVANLRHAVDFSFIQTMKITEKEADLILLLTDEAQVRHLRQVAIMGDLSDMIDSSEEFLAIGLILNKAQSEWPRPGNEDLTFRLHDRGGGLIGFCKQGDPLGFLTSYNLII